MVHSRHNFWARARVFARINSEFCDKGSCEDHAGLSAWSAFPWRRNNRRRPDRRLDAETVLKTITARKSLSQDDEAYVAQLVSKATSISPAEAKSRVVSVEHNIQNSLDNARRIAVLAAFLTAASLAIGAAAAWVQRSPAANTGMRDRC